jgi:hypothetical protein
MCGLATEAAHERHDSRGEPLLPKQWQAFIAFCRELGHGELQVLKIQDGLPVLAEIVSKKVRFGS